MIAATELPAELDLYGTPTAAKILGISRDTLIQEIQKKTIRASNVGSIKRPRWKVSRAAIIDYLDNRSNVKATPPKRVNLKKEANPFF